MTQRLAMMQQQLLVGGVNILDVHAKQEEQLRGPFHFFSLFPFLFSFFLASLSFFLLVFSFSYLPKLQPPNPN